MAGNGREQIAIIGRRQSGKSYLINGMIQSRRQKEAVIVHDMSKQAAYYHLAEIDINQFSRQKSGAYRITTRDHRLFFQTAHDHFKNGLIVSEDASNYLKPSMDMDIYPSIISLRHPEHNVDILFVLHALRRLPPYVAEQLNKIILFKTGDVWDKIKDRFPDNQVDEVKEIFNKVNNSSNPHECEIINIYH